jgi:2'-5' RNA ligase
MTDHQMQQLKVIKIIENQIEDSAMNFSTVAPVDDFESDNRLCLTGVHFPSNVLLDQVNEIIKNLQEIEKAYYYYKPESLHMTIKSVRVISNPPEFTKEDVGKAEKVFGTVIPKHSQFSVYFYRLLLFKNNLALIGTTDPELDDLIKDLDQNLETAGIPDNKQYTNTQYFFINMTLARFAAPSEKFAKAVATLSKKITIDPYTVDSVSLVTGNAVFKKLNIINTWKLQKHGQ